MGDASSASASADGAKKLRRITRACDYCHKRSIRCKFPGTEDDNKCQNCIDFDQPCLFERAVKRRGAKPRAQAVVSDGTSPESIKQEFVYGDICRTPSIASSIPWQEWRAPNIAPHSVIVDLVEIYFEIVYPIYPFFHRATLRRDIARSAYLKDKYKFAAVMAVCALVSARLVDRAVYNPRWNIQELTKIKSEVYYAASVKECGNVGALEQAQFDLLRACALLALTAIQYGKFREFQTHLNKYHCMMAMDMLHDEANWPKNIGAVELEERRRLFWGVYCLDIYSSVLWNGVIRSREQQSSVAYTTELDDDYFDDSGSKFEQHPPTSGHVSANSGHAHRANSVGSSSWLCGWNFVTDLYRVMEHVIANFRDKRQQHRSFLNDIFGEASAVPANNVKNSIMSMYNNLPACFKDTQPLTLDHTQDRYGFQAANITATMQLLRMILFSSGGATIEDRCNIASEVVAGFMRVPVQYLQAMSSPLLHNLTAIGSILGSVFYEPLSESGYMQVRVILLALAQLLENLDHGIHSTASAEKLRRLVTSVDKQMEQQRRGSNDTTSNLRLGTTSHSSPYDADGRSPNVKGEASGGVSSTITPNVTMSTLMPTAKGHNTPMHFPTSNDLFHDFPWNQDFSYLPEG